MGCSRHWNIHLRTLWEGDRSQAREVSLWRQGIVDTWNMDGHVRLSIGNGKGARRFRSRERNMRIYSLSVYANKRVCGYSLEKGFEMGSPRLRYRWRGFLLSIWRGLCGLRIRYSGVCFPLRLRREQYSQLRLL